MQQKNQSSDVFSERTDALAATLHVSIRELAERIGISQAMLFAYRGGKYPISEKAWKKLEAAEAAANQSSYQRKSENQSVVAENVATYGAEPARAPFPSWWDRMPKSAGELEAVLPHVHARLRLAAIIRHEADTNAVVRSEIHDSPLHDAFQDLGLCGTGFTNTTGFSVLTEAFCAELSNLRITHARMEVEASKAAMESLLGRVLHAIGIGPMNLTTKERQEAEAVIARLKQQAAEEAQQGDSPQGKTA